MARLLVSFWDICLENLPEGTFRRRAVTAEAARLAIVQARKADGLLGVCEDDLMAPYRERERGNHAALCAVLGERFGIELSLRDFCSQESDEEGELHFVNPLSCVEIDESRPLMVITCAYTMAEREPDETGMPDFVVEPSSVKFILIEAV